VGVVVEAWTDVDGGRFLAGAGFVAQVMRVEASVGPAALLGACWLMDGSSAWCCPGCSWCGAGAELFADERSAGQGGTAVRTVMVALSVVVVALGTGLSPAG